MYSFEFWKDGKRAAITFSYDDGCIADTRIIELFDKYGLKGTFNLNSVNENYEREHIVSFKKLNDVYKNHEIACHGYNHLGPTSVDAFDIVNDIYEDRKTLEKLTGRIIRGYAYPFGDYEVKKAEIIHNCGIIYARTTTSTNEFRKPKDLMCWNPTCHHRNALNLLDSWNIRVNRDFNNHGLFYIWGHGYEIASDYDWKNFEKLLQAVSGNENVWYATNTEIAEYMLAQQQLIFSADRKTIINPTSTDVWLGDGQVPFKVPACSTVKR